MYIATRNKSLLALCFVVLIPLCFVGVFFGKLFFVFGPKKPKQSSFKMAQPAEPLPENKIYCVTYPGRVKNVDKAIETLGGRDKLSQVRLYNCCNCFCILASFLGAAEKRKVSTSQF
jgi:hypothetical protein